MGPKTLNKIKINLMKSSEFIVFITKTSDPPTQSNNTPIIAPIVSAIGDAVNFNFALRVINE